MRWIVGLLLVVAAILRGVQLIVEPVTTLASPFARWLLPVEAGVELAFGLLVLSGIYWHRVRWLALFTFVVFAGYSFFQVIGGAVSCGCFGPVKVHPSWTFLLDVGIVAGLSVSMLWRTQVEGVLVAPGLLNRRLLAGSIVAISLIGAMLLMRYAQTRTAQAEGLLTSAENLVILEPEKWVGKPLPIFNAINLDLTQGEWIVVLHRHDCPDCQQAVPRYERLALQRPVALVEVAPYGDFHGSTTGAAHHGRLTNNREWFVKTLVELQLQNGIVLAVKVGHGD